MQAFYFGEPSRQLFGALHEPAITPANPRVVVVCAPLWQEGVRAHRALRQMSARLAKAGLYAFRFDYYGAGDSAGDTHEGDLAQWLADLTTAIEAASRARGVSRVTLLGLRFGATLAALTAAARSDVDRLVLWEPVVEGRQYIEQALAAHKVWNEAFRVWRPAPQVSAPTDHPEVLGFPLTDAMKRTISSVDLSALSRTAPRALVVERDPAGRGQELKDHLVNLGARADYELVREAEIWRSAELDQAVVPRQTLDKIVTWLGRSES